jgi:hypothetical protein
MKLRVTYTVEVDDGYRAAINHEVGVSGLATHGAVKKWFELYGASRDDELRDQHHHCCWGDVPIPSVLRRGTA